MSEVDDILNEDGSFSDEEVLEPPQKKRRVDFQKPTKKVDPKEKEEIEAEEETFGEFGLSTKEEHDLDQLRRKELKLILLKHPKLEMKEVMELTERIANMSPEEVAVTLESAKIEIGLKSPMSSAISFVSMVGLLLGRYFKSPVLHQRIMSDTQLLVAVDNFMPTIGEGILGPLQAAVRTLGHITDIQFEQNNFGPGVNPIDIARPIQEKQ